MNRVAEEQASPEGDATQLHPNIALIGRLFALIPKGAADTEGLLAEDFVWHYFNPHLPELAGDYLGLEGLRAFFAQVGAKMQGTFRLDEHPRVLYVGEELVAFHAHHFMTMDGDSLEADAVVVFRIVQGRIAEGWDIV